MNLIAASLLYLIFLPAAMAQPPERGRLYLDHISLVPPPNWAQHVFETNVMFIAPMEIVGADSCSINIGTVGSSGGGPLDVIADIDKKTPGNFLREPVAQPETLSNGWQFAERIYRNQYVRQKFMRVAVIAKQGRGQMVSMAYEYGKCAAVLDATLRTLRVNNDPQRLHASGSPLAMLPPIKHQLPSAETRNGAYDQEVRRAEDFAHQQWLQNAQAEQRRQQNLWKPNR